MPSYNAAISHACSLSRVKELLVALDCQLVVGRGGPTFAFAAFVNHQRLRAWRQYLQRLQKFNHSVLPARGQGVECPPLRQGLAVVRFNRFPGGRELPMMHKRTALVVEAPQLASDEFAVARKERARSSRLVLVEGLTLRIGPRVAGGTNVMQLKVGVCLHHD